MANPAVSCTKCHAALQGNVFNLRQFVPCANCGVPTEAEIFPALFRTIAPGRAGEATQEETESSCFYHPQKKAVLPCDSCGRFLCALCDCEVDGQHLCPTCLEAGRTKGKITKLENRRIVHADIALCLAVFSLVPPIIYFCWLTAPMAIFLSIRHWKTPGSIVHRRTKLRFVLAIIIALLDIAFIIGVIVAIFVNIKR